MRQVAVLLALLVLTPGAGPARAQPTESTWLSSLQMFDAATGWALAAEGGSGVFAKGAIGSVVRTMDGGLHWKDVTPQPPPGKHFFQGVTNIQALSASEAWLVEAPIPDDSDTTQWRPSVIYRTADGGKTWKLVWLPPGIGLMEFINARDGWSVSGTLSSDPQRPGWEPFFEIRRTRDGGRTWTAIGRVELAGYPNQIIPLTRATVWIAGSTQGGIYLYVTHDGGRTWSRPSLPVPSEATGRLSWGSREPDMLTSRGCILSVLYEGSKGSGVFFYASKDGGRTWAHSTPVILPDIPSRDGSIMLGYWGSTFVDLNHGWITDGEALFITGDGGFRWTKVRPRLPFDRPLVGLEFISPMRGWAVSMALEKPFLLKTVDGGRTWTSVPFVILR